MAQAKRIYVVSKGGEVVAFVNAIHPATAIKAVAKDEYSASIATPQQLLEAGRANITIVEA